MTLENGTNTKSRVKEALENNGYKCDDIISASFVHQNETGKEVHKIVFENGEGEQDHGFVFVWSKNGKLFGDF